MRTLTALVCGTVTFVVPTMVQAQAEQALQRAEEFKAAGQVDAESQARANYNTDKLSLQRLAAYRAECVTKLPRQKCARE